ncbi:MAG: hypothetical protein D6690_11355 [Nitrospirae bacterium]|nr:MAG: hypothetical protein D6690_11355 [Nitrospirota bacterium]
MNANSMVFNRLSTAMLWIAGWVAVNLGTGGEVLALQDRYTIVHTLPPGVSKWTVASDGSGQFTSIQEAIDQAQEGDTIWIKSGTYAEDVTVFGKNRLKIVGESTEDVILSGLHRVGTLHIGKWPYGVQDVEIHALTVKQHGGLGVGIFNGGNLLLKHVRVEGMLYGQYVSHVLIEHCQIGGSETTGVGFADSQAVLRSNFIHDNDHGVSIGGTSHLVLEQNVITRHLYEAVLVSDSAQAMLIRNTLVRNGGGVTFRDQSRGEVRGNIIAYNRVGLQFSPASRTKLAFNAVYHNAVPYQLIGTPPRPAPERAGKSDVTFAPLFVEPMADDFRLRPDSPLIDIGGYPYLGALPPLDGRRSSKFGSP